MYAEYKLEVSGLIVLALKLTKNERAVAVIERKCIAVDGCYQVEVDETEDQTFILAMVTIIIQVLYP